MIRKYSLSHLSALDLTPLELLILAEKIGYDFAGLRLLPPERGIPAYQIADNNIAIKEISSFLDNSNVKILDIEVYKLHPLRPVNEKSAFFEAGAVMGARNVLVIAPSGFGLIELSEHFSILCEYLVQYNLTANLEFMSWTGVKDIVSAINLMELSGWPVNARILIDTFHFYTSKSEMAHILKIPSDRIDYIQVSDTGPIFTQSEAKIKYHSRNFRLVPGDGCIDLQSIISAIPPTAVLSFEAWNKYETRSLGTERWAEVALKRLKHFDMTLSSQSSLRQTA